MGCKGASPYFLLYMFVYAIFLYILYFIFLRLLGREGSHFLVTGIHSLVATILSLITLLWEDENIYETMLSFSAAFMIADIPFFVSYHSDDADFLVTVTHHCASALASLILVGEVSISIAGFTHLAEASTVIYCFRQVLRTQGWRHYDGTITLVFRCTHLVVRGPLLFYVFVTMLPQYLSEGDSIRYVLGVCGIIFLLLNQMWNYSILKSYGWINPKKEN